MSVFQGKQIMDEPNVSSHGLFAALQVDTWYKAGIAEGISVSVNQRG